MRPAAKHYDYHLFTHALFFIVITVIVYFWVTLPHTVYYTLQLALFFLVAYFLNFRLSHRIRQEAGKPHQPHLEKHYEVLINTSLIGGVVLLLTASTGGVASPWFFMVYFFMFAAALLLEKEIVIIYTLVTLLFFTLLPSSASLYWYFVRLVSLLMIAPVAYYLGYKYDQVRRLQQDYNQSLRAGGRMEQDIIYWLKLECLPALESAADKLSTIMPSVRQSYREVLGQVLKTVKRLLNKADKLSHRVDEIGDRLG